MLRSPLLTVHEAADLLKVKESTVRSLINEKHLRAVKVGKEWRIAEVDLLQFLNDNANRAPDAGSGDADSGPDAQE